MPNISMLRNSSPYLTGFARTYYEEELFLAEDVMPPRNVPNDVDVYPTFNNDHYRYDSTNTDLMMKSTDKSIAQEFDIGISSGTYHLQLYREKVIVGVLEGDAASTKNIKLKEAKVRGLKHHMSVYKEKKFAEFIFGSGNYASGNKAALSGSAIWNATNNMLEAAFYTKNTPKWTVRSAIDTVRKTSGGKIVNTMCVGAAVHDTIMKHPHVLKYMSDAADATVEKIHGFIAKMFGVINYYPLLSVYNSAIEGSTDSMSDVGGAYVALLYQPTNAFYEFDAPFGVMFNRESFPSVAEWIDDDRMGATVVENRELYAHESVSDVSGFLLTTVVT